MYRILPLAPVACPFARSLGGTNAQKAYVAVRLRACLSGGFVRIRESANMDDTLLIALIVVVFNGAFDAFVVAWIPGKRSKQALLKALQYPDEETEDAIFNLLDMSWSWLTDQNKMAQMWNWVMTSQIETGNVIKTTNDAGEETST